MNRVPHSRKRTMSGAMQFLITLFILTHITDFAGAQPVKNWDRSIGGAKYEELNALLLVPDGILAAGTMQSVDNTGIPNDTSYNILITKLDFDGNQIWSSYFGGDSTDRLWSLIPTSDGGFIGGGHSYSGKGWSKTDSSRGAMDVWIYKLDALGQLQWDKTYGSRDTDELFSILEMPDHGGFLLGCHSYSNKGGEKSENSKGNQDLWLIGIDNQGNVLWDKTIGGNGTEQIDEMKWAPDGNVMVMGSTNSIANSGDIGSDFARGGKDFFLMKFDPVGHKIVWNHRYGGTQEDIPYSLCVSQFGGYYLGGSSGSPKAPPTTANNGKDSEFRGGFADYWLVRVDENGKKLKDWSFGGSGHDDLYYVQENLLGQLLLGGVSDSDVSGNKTAAGLGKYDFWVLSLDKDMNQLWQQTMGGSESDALTKMVECPSGGFIVGGHSMSALNANKSEGTHGVNDFWIANYCCSMPVEITEISTIDPCGNEPLLLEAKANGCDECVYFWSNGEMSRYLELQPGTVDSFSVLVLDKRGCKARDTIFANVSMPPVIDLGLRDTTVFEYQSIVIGGNNPQLQYKWNTGDTTATIVVQHAGVFALTVTDANGCQSRDWIKVRLVKKDHVWVPNIFNPDFNGNNDVVNIYADKSVRQIKTFQIADRWGTVYFRKDNYAANYETDGWNGKYRGKRVPIGNYLWMAEVEYIDGKKEIYSGTILVAR
jgi:gliding motility-associated-like protein